MSSENHTNIVRLAHSRFYQGEPAKRKDVFDKVVTSVWSFESDTGILTYAATVYKKSGPRDFWCKQQHKTQAMDRFKNNPLRIRMISQNAHELTSSGVDWFISRHCIYHYGTHNKTDPDVRRVHHEYHVRPDFNSHYNPYYKQESYEIHGSISAPRTCLPSFTIAGVCIGVLCLTWYVVTTC